MNSAPSVRRTGAFTLVEMLTVIAIIGILAALLLPVLSEGKARAKRIWCENNLEQIGLAFHMYANDHQGKFPMHVPMSEGGAQEFVQNGYLVNREFYFSFRQFQVMPNALGTPKILVCPGDTRPYAPDFRTLQNNNLSYCVGVTADPLKSRSILAGDRNITNGSSLNPTIIQGDASGVVRWTRELHEYKGNMLFADTHVEEWNSVTISGGSNGPLAADNLFLPSVMPDLLLIVAGPPASSTGSSPVVNPDSASTDNAGSPSGSGSQSTTPMASPPGSAANNSVNHPMAPATTLSESPPVQNSLEMTNVTPSAVPIQTVVAFTASNQLNLAMSPFDRQVVRSLHSYAAWGYGLLVLCVLLLQTLFEARRRWRRLRGQQKLRESFLDSDE
jgi:prepilin-type N-terminal cleavage/methylation domain-containing protein/prepilin-type processing-associated H-X9-DG protein